jgi:hypothetical protein
VVNASPTAAGLLAFDPAQAAEHHFTDFIVPGTTDEVAVMLDILADVGAAESRFQMPRADGSLIEFDSYTTIAGEEFVTVMRPAAQS